MKSILVAVALALPLAACQSFGSRTGPRGAPANAAAANANVEGVYDNHAQVWAARENASAVAAPHVRVVVETTGQREWTIWRVHLDASPAMDATWAFHKDAGATTAGTLVPHRALVAAPAVGKHFDPAQWAPLEACALRPAGPSMSFAGDAATCTVLAPGIGAQMALLPLAVTRDGEWLRVRFYADQARGPDAREDLRRVQTFSGWAAINGGGPKAAADSNDWHMDRSVRLDNEGGRYALHWRDGGASGYSLALERVTYRDGNMPVLKLSVIEDASGQTLAYAWANPEATRIGINLGWVQVGLEGLAQVAPK